MKHFLKICIFVSLAALIGCKSGGGGSGSSTTTVSDPYNSVYDGGDDYDSGYWDGYNDGYNGGYNDGYDDGYYDGDYDGYYDGYDDGYWDGYYGASDAGEATDTNFSAGRSESSKARVQKAADRLASDYGLPQEKAVSVASALYVWKLASVERGYTTDRDINDTFTKVFGVKLSDATAAVKSFSTGDKESMRDLTNRSASALGLKPHQAKKFIKGMYKKALADNGYDAESIDW
jgi:hypothetical protein